jgi:hypothetical protein
MDDEQKVIYMICGGLALIVAGILFYSAWKTPTAIPMTLVRKPRGTVANPVHYYTDTPEVDKDQPLPTASNDSVPKKEVIHWTDWNGRDRIVAVPRGN